MKLRPIIFWSHLIIGGILGILILVMSTTGAMLAFRPQILNITDHHLKKIEMAGLHPQRMNLNDLLKKIQKEHPEFDSPRMLAIQPDQKNSFVFQYGKKTRQIAYINPYTAEVLGGESKTSAFLKTVEGFHRWFGFEGAFRPVAQNIKDITNVIFLLMILSGVYLWWPFKIFRFGRNLSGKSQNWNLHSVFGIWAAPFLMIISFSGIIMAYPPKAPERMTPVKVSRPATVDWEHAFKTAQAKKPHWEIIMLQLNKPEAPFRIKDSHWNFQTWMRYSHTGEAFGIIGQILAFAASLSAIMLIFTGFAMIGTRFSKKPKG